MCNFRLIFECVLRFGGLVIKWIKVIFRFVSYDVIIYYYFGGGCGNKLLFILDWE